MLSFKQFTEAVIKLNETKIDYSKVKKIEKSYSNSVDNTPGFGLKLGRRSAMTPSENLRASQAKSLTHRKKVSLNTPSNISIDKLASSLKKPITRSLEQHEIEHAFKMKRDNNASNMDIANHFGISPSGLTTQLLKHKDQPYYFRSSTSTKKPIIEAHKFYSDTGGGGPPMTMDAIKRYRMKDIMPKYQEHMTNMYILRHLNSHPTTPTNDKIDYTNQLAIAHKKMKNIVDTHPTFKKEQVALRANHARIAAHARLGEMGYHDFELPKKMEDPKVANLPTTKDGRKLFGV